MSVEGKVVLVSGASEGIGFAIARQLADGGARVVLTARRPAQLTAAARALGRAALAVTGDISAPGAAQEAVGAALAHHGRLDGVVCNAGVFIGGPLLAQPMDEVERMLAINLRGTIGLMAAAAPALVKTPGAAAVVVSSALGRHPTPGTGIYGATKAALNHLVATWAAELAPQGVRVNAVSAGPTDTPGFRAGTRKVPRLEETMVGSSLVKRLGQPDEVARPVVTLLDNEMSGYVTGAVWDIDGGAHRDHTAPATMISHRIGG
jgi:NAD(P)-dependent dehydrogenase (short-subunit alcohol dehydrogenase family)